MDLRMEQLSEAWKRQYGKISMSLEELKTAHDSFHKKLTTTAQERDSYYLMYDILINDIEELQKISESMFLLK
jgi:hypothetical protein